MQTQVAASAKDGGAGMHLTCQYLYFSTSKASKLSTWHRSKSWDPLR
jgi:hypothetical protein